MNLTPTFSAEQIATRVAELGKEIRSDAGASDVFLLGILKGTSCFLADLIRTIPGSVSYGFIDVIRDIADTAIADALEIDFMSFTEIGGRNVYVLKDVVSTGVIENYLLTQLRQHEPKSLKLVALLDRPELRTVDLAADFKAFEVGDGSWAGYGLEIDGRWGNLPYIGKV
jgi:hypoxanthine phosphoribosyltransferase